MHEMSIAIALLDLAIENVPAGSKLQGVRIKAGPMRGIDADSMKFAWDAILLERNLGQVALDMNMLPWQFACDDCHKEWSGFEIPERCVCGSANFRPVGGNDLQLVSLEVEDSGELAQNAG